MPSGSLTPLQRDVLEGFFSKERRFYLSGGAALVAFYLHHRETEDLDLFTNQGILEEGERVLEAIMMLERAGYRVEDVLAATREKDPSVEPAVLRWTLKQFTLVGDDELETYRRELMRRLARLAFPANE